MRWLRRNIDEIAGDPVLRVYGALLAVTHVLSFLSWKITHPTDAILSKQVIPICWPFFESCADYRVLDAAGVRVLLWVYLAAAAVTVLLFAPRRLVAVAYWALVLLTVFKTAIWIQDYRLRLNQHYMAFFITLVYLFLPGKRRLLRYQLVAFYFWAGTLKLNREWLSGAALYGAPWLVPASLRPASCVYVVVLELALVWGLFARRGWVFWATFAQLVLFHVTSFGVVGFFYPTLMFALLAIFPLARLVRRAPEEPSPRRLFARGGEPWSTRGWLAAFSLLQILPWLFPGDTAITGEGRLFALHMFDARIECVGTATLYGEARPPQVMPLRGRLPTRIRCDPIVYLSIARGLCKKLHGQRGFVDLDLSLRSRRSTEAELRPVIDVKRFCANPPTYRLWWPNAWIQH